MDKLNHLKANIHIQSIDNYLKSVKKKWRPKTKEIKEPYLSN